MISTLLTGLFSLWFFASSAILVCVSAVLCAVTAPFDPNRRIVHLYSCWWAYHYLQINPLWRCSFEGLEHIDASKPYVLVANHQSYWDIMLLYGLFKPFKWVSKDSIFNIPFLGLNMRLNQYVEIARGDLKSVKEMMADCKGWLKRGAAIMIFPEGTRSENGEIGQFRDGPFKMAVDCGVPVIPIVLDGTFGVLPKGAKRLRFTGELKVKVLPAVNPEDFSNNVRHLRDHVRTSMVDTLAELRGKPVVSVK